MEQNKTGKYFKYAIGEILLVVIGILIALGINNWNEQRKDRIEEHSFLSAIKVDLLATQEELNKTINLQSRVVNRCVNLINLMEEYEITEKREALILTHAPLFRGYIQKGALLWWRAEPITGSYDAMMGSGKTALITNAEISRKLAHYSSLTMAGFEEQENAMNIPAKLGEDVSPYLNSIWVYNENWFREGDEIINLKYDEAKVKRAMSGILDNKSFQGSLIQKTDIEIIRRNQQLKLLNITLELIVLIDIELGNTTSRND